MLGITPVPRDLLTPFCIIWQKMRGHRGSADRLPQRVQERAGCIVRTPTPRINHPDPKAALAGGQTVADRLGEDAVPERNACTGSRSAKVLDPIGEDRR
jgi:hypothetical protein